MSYTAEYIADKINGTVVGSKERLIVMVSAINDPKEQSITFCAHAKFYPLLDRSESRVIIVDKHITFEPGETTTFIKVDNVYQAYAQVAELIHGDQAKKSEHKISLLSSIDQSSTLGEDVGVGAYTVIKEGAIIGDTVNIHEQVLIAENVVIGARTIIHAGVKILPGVSIGSDCIIYPNAVIGGDGFGHVLHPDGHTKIRHSGSVIIEDNVEIGANTVIDKAAIGVTIIRQGVKLDNLIQIAHGVEIGQGTVMAAQSGVSGSTTVGENCVVGGQVAISGHLTVAPGSQIAGKSGVASTIKKPNQKWYGYPVIGYMNYLRSFSFFKRLPELANRIKKLEEKVNS